MVVPSALPLKLVCDVTRLRRNFGHSLENFLRTPLATRIETKQVFSLHCVSRLDDSDIGQEEWVLSNLGDVALATRFENDQRLTCKCDLKKRKIYI